jgi:hypothetical protein
MNRSLGLALFVIATLVTWCDERIDGYMAASSISANGFARDAKEIRKAQGQEIELWGFVDHRNLYGDAGAKRILGEWWSGDGPDAATWRFDLKARENDEAGHSFAVRVPDDGGRDDLLRAFLADARAQWSWTSSVRRSPCPNRCLRKTSTGSFSPGCLPSKAMRMSL